jgi:hypothetical protein
MWISTDVRRCGRSPWSCIGEGLDFTEFSTLKIENLAQAGYKFALLGTENFEVEKSDSPIANHRLAGLWRPAFASSKSRGTLQ